MEVEKLPVDRLDITLTVSRLELGSMCGLSVAEVDELVDYGLLVPMSGAETAQPTFSAACVLSLRQAAALRRRFDLDVFATGLLYAQFERVSDLERQIRSLEARLPRTPPEGEGPASWREPHG